MNLSEPFIRRPVMTTLVMAGIFLFGVIAYQALPISDLPSFAFPVITVTAQNPGMDGETMASNVATPLEQQLMSIDGIQTIVSTNMTNTTRIAIQFDMNKSIESASTDVSAAINRAAGNLPPEMPNPPTYQKFNPADTPVIYIAVTSESMTLGDLYDYANSAVAQRVSMFEGVSEVQLYGSPRAIRTKINPDKIAAMGISLNEVASSVVKANQELPSGTVYDKNISYTLNPLGQITEAKLYDDVIVAERDQSPVYLRDIGKGVESTAEEQYFFRYWTKEKGDRPAVVCAVTKQSGYNTVALCNKIRDFLPEMQTEIPASIDLEVMYDASIAIKDSINDVKFTLLIAFILVVIVIFLFLGNMSTTIIPTAALPLAIIGTFAMMYVNSYSIDILSMMGLTLVVGFLVDDAIVVLENIVRHMEQGKSPFQAALDGSKEISSTVLSMTLSLSAVFIPIIFMPGIIGSLFHEFGMVVVIAVLFSGAISLSLTPMLCSRFLRTSSKKSFVEKMANKIMGFLVGLYEPALRWTFRHRFLPIGLTIGSFIIAIFLLGSIPKDFLPPGDTGAIQGLTEAGQKVSLDKMAELQNELNEAMEQNPYVESVISVANFSKITPANQGIVFLTLSDINKRPDIQTVTSQINKNAQKVAGIKAFLNPIPQINLNVGTSVQKGNYEYAMSTIENPEELYAKAAEFIDALKDIPELADVSSNMETNSPQLKITMLRDQASNFGVTVKDIEETFSRAYSGARVSTYNTPLNIYNIIVQLEDDYRSRPSDLKKIWLRPSNGETDKLVPLENVASWEETVGPLEVNHTNQFTSASAFFNLAPNAALGTALQKVEEKAEEILPQDIIKSFQGQANIFQGTMGMMSALLIIGIIAIYLLLGSLYESFIHPLTILSTLPGALFGGMVTLFAFNATLSLYSYVGLIVLIGIVMKNGIMLVEFCIEKVEEGMTPEEAAIESALVRFRPILMTTVAAAMGAVPIALGIGADASSRRPLGLVILGGLLFAQFVSYFFTPIAYVYLEKLQQRLKSKKKADI